MAEYPDNNDKEFDLWLKIAQNWYEIADALGFSVPEITSKESLHSLQRKVAFITGTLAA